NHVRPRGEPRSPLEVNDVRPIHPVPILDPSQIPRARDGRRPHPLDEPVVVDPKSLALFDELFRLYPRKDREQAALGVWRALDLSLEQAALVVAHVRVRLKTAWRDTPARY